MERLSMTTKRIYATPGRRATRAQVGRRRWGPAPTRRFGPGTAARSHSCPADTVGASTQDDAAERSGHPSRWRPRLLGDGPDLERPAALQLGRDRECDVASGDRPAGL